MSVSMTNNLNGWVDQMMSSLKISDYKLDVSGSTVKGDGYVGEVTFVKVKTSKNGTKKDYDLVIKSAKQSEELRKQTPVKEAYDRESLFYSKIFPALNDLQKQKKLRKLFDKVPTCYSVSQEIKKEAVILQNLKTLGFDLHDRKKPMNLNHVLLVFQNYGRYHALSLALKNQKPAVFKELTKELGDLFGQFIVQTNMMGLFYKDFENLKNLLKKNKHDETLQKIAGLEKDFENILCNYTNEETTPSVLLHGDCWNNNFMFKYEGSDRSKPTDMKFLDFQLVRVGSPIIDLSYFLYSCAGKEVLKEFDFIIQAYYSSLSDTLSELGCDAEELCSFTSLKKQWREYGRFGLVLSLFLLKISLCDSNEAPDLLESAESGKDFSQSFQVKLKDEENYNERVQNIYLHFAEKFL